MLIKNLFIIFFIYFFSSFVSNFNFMIIIILLYFSHKNNSLIWFIYIKNKRQNVCLFLFSKKTKEIVDMWVMKGTDCQTDGRTDIMILPVHWLWLNTSRVKNKSAFMATQKKKRKIANKSDIIKSQRSTSIKKHFYSLWVLNS